MSYRNGVYNGSAILTTAGRSLSDSVITGLIRSYLIAHGVGVVTNGTVRANDDTVYLSVTTPVDCNIIDLNSIASSLSQTVEGTQGEWGTGSIFSSVNLADSGVVYNTCPYGTPAYNAYNTSGGNTGGGNTSGGNTTSSGNTYTVRAGDTFSGIAARFGLTINQLQALNPQVANINVISVGQVLNVSGTPTTLVTAVNPNTGQAQVQNVLSLPSGNTGNNAGSNTNNNAGNPPTKNWFDRTFFTGAGALSGVGIGVLVVLGAVVVTQRYR